MNNVAGALFLASSYLIINGRGHAGIGFFVLGLISVWIYIVAEKEAKDES